MKTTTAVAVSEFVVLAGLAGFMAFDDGGQAASAVVLGLGSLAVAVGVLRLLRRVTRTGRTPGAVPAVIGLVSALGLVGAVAYLHSLPAGSADIPLAGVGLLLLSVAGLIATAVLLACTRPTAGPAA